MLPVPCPAIKMGRTKQNLATGRTLLAGTPSVQTAAAALLVAAARPASPLLVTPHGRTGSAAEGEGGRSTSSQSILSPT